MEVQYLEYIGPKQEGEVVIRQENPLSKWRKIKVYQGMRLEVGKEIPESVARRVMKMLGNQVFKLKKVTLDNNEKTVHRLSEIFSSYRDQLKDDAAAVLPALTVEALLLSMGDDAIESILKALKHSQKVRIKEEVLTEKVLEIFSPEKKGKKSPPVKKATSKEEAEEKDKGEKVPTQKPAKARRTK